MVDDLFKIYHNYQKNQYFLLKTHIKHKKTSQNNMLYSVFFVDKSHFKFAFLFVNACSILYLRYAYMLPKI